MDEYDKFKNKVITNQIVRVIIDFLVLIGLQLPLFIKILIIMITDFLDTTFPFYLDMVQPNLFDEYEKIDKVGDMIIYTTLWIYYIKFDDSPLVLKNYITLLFLFRWMGYLIYRETNKRNIFVMFPNLFLESLFVISLLQYMGYSYSKYYKLYFIVLSLTFVFKIIHEMYIHTPIFNSIKY